MYPLVRRFCEEHFRELNNKHLDWGADKKEVSTPGIGEEHMPRYKRHQTLFMVALNLQGVWEVLFQARHDVDTLHQDSDISFH